MRDKELFPAEFRHEQVTRFIRGLVEGSIKIKGFDDTSSDARIYTVAELTNELLKYVSGKLRGEELDAVEQNLFRWLAIMKISDGVEERITETQMEKEIKALQLRIDSTNTLLIEIMTILKEFMKFFDEK